MRKAFTTPQGIQKQEKMAKTDELTVVMKANLEKSKAERMIFRGLRQIEKVSLEAAKMQGKEVYYECQARIARWRKEWSIDHPDVAYWNSNNKIKAS